MNAKNILKICKLQPLDPIYVKLTNKCGTYKQSLQYDNSTKEIQALNDEVDSWTISEFLNEFEDTKFSIIEGD